MTWWTVREELLVAPVAACIYGCCCRAGMRAMGWKMLRSGRKMSFFARCSNTRRSNKCRGCPVHWCVQAVYRRGVEKVELFAFPVQANALDRAAPLAGL